MGERLFKAECKPKSAALSINYAACDKIICLIKRRNNHVVQFGSPSNCGHSGYRDWARGGRLLTW